MNKILSVLSTIGNTIVTHNTFNGKPIWRNAITAVVSIVGLCFVVQAWIYYLVVQLVVVPKEKWINPLSDVNRPVHIPHTKAVCEHIFNAESTFNHQLALMQSIRESEYGTELEDEIDEKDLGV